MTDSLPPDQPTAPAARRVLVVTLVVAVAWNLIGNLLLPGVLYVPANLGIVVLLVVIARRAGFDLAALGLDRSTWGSGLRYGLIAMAVVAAGLAIAVFLPWTEDVLLDDGVRDDSTFDRWFVPLVRIPLGTALYEEVLFRSVLFGALVVLVGTRWTLVVTSILFGLWHIVPSWETAEGGFVSTAGSIVGAVGLTTVAGFLFGGLRLWSKSALAPILAHTATNSFAYVAALIAIERAG